MRDCNGPYMYTIITAYLINGPHANIVLKLRRGQYGRNDPVNIVYTTLWHCSKTFVRKETKSAPYISSTTNIIITYYVDNFLISAKDVQTINQYNNL